MGTGGAQLAEGGAQLLLEEVQRWSATPSSSARAAGLGHALASRARFSRCSAVMPNTVLGAAVQRLASL